MSFLSLKKFGDNLPVTSVVALSQAAIGIGAGLLIAEKLGRSARHRTALALIGVGAATVFPIAAGIIQNVNERPGSSRDMERRLAGIRRESGTANGGEIY